MSDLWNNTIGYMKKASKALNLDEEILNALLKCKRVLEFQIPLRMIYRRVDVGNHCRRRAFYGKLLDPHWSFGRLCYFERNT